ncbi:dihydrofolate reductase family protein [Kitasatospora nipponensis]|uniref:Dihydrofolate reductase family protein n=1 Tax=Kitasatospora nipponensis TaxID=258049 RepID=A0ABN1WBH4_9ACTN
MRKIVLMGSVSLDGYMAGPDRELDWHRVDDEVHAYINDRVRSMGAFLNGRVMYELMADFWPTADADPAAGAPVVDFAGIWRAMPKVVYSRTLEHADWNATVVREVVPQEVRALKEQPGGDLLLGGADLSATFLRLGLVDEFHLYIHPVVIGSGKRFFPTTEARSDLDLDLVETHTFGNGVILLRHERSRHPRVSPAGSA